MVESKLREALQRPENARERVHNQRPKLTVENVPDYLDWLTSNLTGLHPAAVDHHLRACELVVRLRMGDAQAKDTQNTLIREGLIEAPSVGA